MRTLAFLALFLGLVSCAGEKEEGAALASGVQSPIDRAVAEAARSGRSVLVQYVKEGCSCCRKMEEETLSDLEVRELLGKVVHVRLTKGLDGEAFEARFEAPKTPAFVVLGPDGKVRGDVVTGPIDVGDFLVYLDWVVEGDGPAPEVLPVEDGCGGCGDEEDTGGGCGGCGEE